MTLALPHTALKLDQDGTQPVTLRPGLRAQSVTQTGEVKGDEQQGKGWEPGTAAFSPGPLGIASFPALGVSGI